MLDEEDVACPRNDPQGSVLDILIVVGACEVDFRLPRVRVDLHLLDAVDLRNDGLCALGRSLHREAE